jgi:hypothetical protein
MNTKNLPFLLGAAAILAATILSFLLMGVSPSESQAEPPEVNPSHPPGIARRRKIVASRPGGDLPTFQEPDAPDDKFVSTAPAAPHSQRALAWISMAHEDLRGAGGAPELTRKILGELREKLRSLPPGEAAAAISEFLNTGEDESTGLPFVVGKNGSLTDAPTLRIALLDLLGESGPFVAVDYARRIFGEARSADEWALAMRNLARADGVQHQEEIGRRLTEMLDNTEWLSNPSGGFLEAFDLAVYLGGTEQIANMASVLGHETETEGLGVNRAAFTAIDRLFVGDREAAFRYIEQDPDLLSWVPLDRAALVARANVIASGELRAVETYLTREGLSNEEANEFFSLFPNRNYSSGNRLASSPESGMAIGEVEQSDAATRVVVERWIGDPRFSTHLENLTQLRHRLDEFAGQVAAAAEE